MKKIQWNALLEALSEYQRMPNPDELQSTGVLEVEGIPTQLIFNDADEHADPALPAQICVRFLLDGGPHAVRQQLNESLLVANFMMGVEGGCVWSRHPLDESVICTYSVPVPIDTSAAEFGEALESLAKAANTMWAKNIAVFSKTNVTGNFLR